MKDEEFAATTLGSNSLMNDLVMIDDNDDNSSIDDDSFVILPDPTFNEQDLADLHEIDLPILHYDTVVPSRSSSSNNTKDYDDNTNKNGGDTTPELSYFYLRDEVGLSEDVMWKLVNKAPSFLGFTPTTIRNKLMVLKATIGLTDQDIRQLLQKQPSILHLSAKKNISPTILYLQRQLDLSKKELRTLVLGCPSLLTYSLGSLHGKIVGFFQNTMGYTVAECRTIFLKCPTILSSSVKTGLIPRLQFLHDEIQISLPDLRKIILQNPLILCMSIEDNLQPKLIYFFIMTLRMQPTDVGTLLLKYPNILDYNLENHIVPIYQYFISLDFSTYEFSKILQKFPRLMTYSLAHIKRRMGYLRFQLGLEANAIRRIFYQNPKILSFSQTNLENTVQYLLQSVVPGATLLHDNYDEGDDDGDTNEKGNGERIDSDGSDENPNRNLEIVQILITGLPSVVNLNVQNTLQPKVEYLRERLGQEELSNALLRLPVLLGYSLDKRIKPRLEQMLAAGVHGGLITSGITKKEDAFQQWLERRANEAVHLPSKIPEIDNESKKQNEKANEKDITSKETRVVKDGGRIIHWRRGA